MGLENWSVLVLNRVMARKHTIFLGGKVAVPMDSSENQLFTQLAEQYYQTCEAAEQSGKTAWIGIEPDISVKPQRWRVREILSKLKSHIFRC